MTNFSNLNDIIQRILDGNQTDSDIEALREWLNNGGIQNLQLGKYNVNIGQGEDIHIGDKIYQGLDAQAIREVVEAIIKGYNTEDIRKILYSIVKEYFSQNDKKREISQSILEDVEVQENLSIGNTTSVDELVKKVRSRFHDDIQCLHGTMPLWGVDRWVSLGDLFVDVNILELISSNRRSELNDLWQDFTSSNSDYRSLDRIGLGKKQQRVSGLAVLERDTNLMVVGKPGSGKTTYLQRIVNECNNGKLKANRIPVLIKLREFVDDGRKYAYNLEQFLEYQWRLNNADLELILNLGLTLILLDGLDEVTGEAGKQITKEIKRFARTYPQVQILVTCRTQSQRSRFERFDYVEIADFNKEQVRAFAVHWFRTVCKDVEEGEKKEQEFLSQLFREENKPIRELAITPILLSLTCAVFHQTEKFYSKRSKLYEEGLELLLEQWDKSREVERDEIYRDLSVERKLELLSYIAFKKFEQKQYVLFDQEELEGYIGEFLGIEKRESREVLKAIESQHGLLIERAQKVWSFSHLTFQEYFTAQWFICNADWENLVSHIREFRWQQVFLLAVEILKNADQLLMLIKSKINTIFSSYFALDKNLKTVITYAYLKSLQFQINGNSEELEFIDFAYRRGVFCSYLPCNNVKLLYLNLIFYRPFKLNKNLDYISRSLREYENNLALYGSVVKNFSSINDFFNNQGSKDYFELLQTSKLIDGVLDHFISHFFNLALSYAYLIKSNFTDFLNDNKKHRQIYRLIQEFQAEMFALLRRSFQETIKLNTKYEYPPLKEFFQQFAKILPDLDNNLDGFWKWIRDFRSEMIKHRNICHDWQISEQHIELLKNYYYTNTILVDCLNRASQVSRQIRETIEDTLLLPVAEIEKLNQENH